jgi:hypothetical protein
MSFAQVNDELLLPLMDARQWLAVHFQTLTDAHHSGRLLCQCSPNAGIEWFVLEQVIEISSDQLT